MSREAPITIAAIGIDIGKNSFHVVGHDKRGAIVLRQKWSRGQIEARLANMRPCLIGMEACVGAHHLSRRLKVLRHDARLMPAKYVRPYAKGQKNDFNDAEAIAEAVQRPTMKFVAIKTASSTCERCIAFESGSSRNVPASSIRSVRSCWNAASPCARASASCVPSCRSSWLRVRMCCLRACCASSKTSSATGGASMSASRPSRARSKRLPGRMPAATDS